MRNIESHKKEFIKNLPFFKGLEDDDFYIFVNNLNVKDYSKGQTVFLAGGIAEQFFVILDGWVKLYRTTPEGEESVLSVFTKGDVFGETAIFVGGTYSFCAQIAENAKILEIPAKLLHSVAEKNPSIMNRIMASMSSEIHKLQLEKEHLSIMTAPQRVGCLLIQLSSGMIGNGGTFTFPYDKSLAAARLGMKPETFSRALSQLIPFSVHVKGSEIHIESFGCLVKYVCGHCSLQEGQCRGAGL